MLKAISPPSRTDRAVLAGACSAGDRNSLSRVAAIERYRASDAAFIARCKYEDELDDASGPGRTPETVAVVNA